MEGNMILYYTGTGNSAFAAQRLGRLLQDEVLDLFDRIREGDHSPLRSHRPWVIVTPTYAWRIPRILQDWLKKTRLEGSRQIYFVMTCGDSIGNAGAYAKKLCASLPPDSSGMDCMGCFQIVMPENYIALFSAPDSEEALRIIHRAQDALAHTASAIQNGERSFRTPVSLTDRFCSGPVNVLFYPLIVHARAFTVNAHTSYGKPVSHKKCVSCGKCASLCPLNNITLQEGHPVWGKNCTHCMACISCCPTQAIEYGRSTRRKRRYIFPADQIRP